MEVILGVGNIEVRSWWIHFRTLEGEPIWEGIVDATGDGKNGLNVNRSSIPVEIQQKLRTIRGYTATWEPVAEQLPTPLLTDGSNKDTGSAD